MATVKGFKVGNDTLLYQDENLAQEFSTSEIYEVGDYVINPDDGKLYKCVTAITTAGGWDSTKWAEARIGDEVDDLKSALTSIDNNVVEGFESYGIPYLPKPKSIMPYKSLSSGGNIVNNLKNLLIHDITVNSGYIIGLKEYTDYRFYIKYWNGPDYLNSWQTEDYKFSQTVRISVYLQKIDGTNLTESDIQNLLSLFRVTNSNIDLTQYSNQISILQSQIGFNNYPSNLIYKGKVISSGGTLSDNTAITIIFPIDVNANDTVGLTDYSVYKICFKKYTTSWSDASAWQLSDYSPASAERLCMYIMRQDKADMTDSDVSAIEQIAFCELSSGLEKRVSELESNSYDLNFGTDFKNNFVPTNILTLPTQFNNFPVEIEISKYGKMYGHNLNARNFVVNNSNDKTYYVSPDGDDANAGTEPSAPLKTIGAAVNKSDVNTIVLLNGIYLNGTHFDNTAIAKSINLIGEGKVILKSGTGDNPLTFTEGCYIENIIFDGGKSACITQLEDVLFVANKCAFLNSSTANGLTAKGGLYVLFDCVANNNMLDGFNYHSNDSTYYPKVIEIECSGKLNGDKSNLNQNNGSTIHEGGSKAIRIGCDYSSCRAGVIADADGAFSLNIACKASSTEAITVENRNGNYVSIHNTKMWLYDCVSFGSPYDIISDNATIYTNVTYNRESAVNSGTITRLE